MRQLTMMIRKSRGNNAMHSSYETRIPIGVKVNGWRSETWLLLRLSLWRISGT